jgi:flagellar hook protein FlgE
MSFQIALSGINSINTQLETISHNIANTGTYGYKASRANFSSMYAGTQPNGAEVSSLTQSIDIGGGIISPGRGMEAAIQGRGFFVTRDSTGAEVYTRVGIFATDKDGFVIDALGRRVQGYAQPVDAGGRPIEGAALGALGDLRVSNGQIPAQASTALDYTANMSADWEIRTVPFDKDDPLSYNSSTVSVAYDSQGGKHSVTQYFVKTATNEVTVHYFFDGAAAATASAVLGFAADGQLAAIDGVAPVPPTPTPTGWKPVFPPVAVALGTPAGVDPMAIDIDYNGSTQFAGQSIIVTNAANGYAAGALNGVQVDEDGSIMAVYSNGMKLRTGTVALATFANEGALVPVSDTSWVSSNASGVALYTTPGTGAGLLSQGALEQSNVDVTAELVNLMSAQRNYQANTKVISTQNEMMQNLMQAV